MSKVLKTIDIELTQSSLNKAIREMKRFQEMFVQSMNELVRKLAEEGAHVAKIQVASMDAVDTGQLEGSIYGYFDPESRIGYVIAGAAHAFYVEYGTGPVGMANPHPEASAAGWQYMVGEHIKMGPGGFGWWYDKSTDGDDVFEGTRKFHWTHGQPARPFMFNTLQWLEEAAETIAETIWNQM